MPDPALCKRAGSDLFAQNLREKIAEIKKKLERLTDAYLAGALELAEYQQTKNALTAEKKTLEEKLADPALCKRAGGNHWLELTRNWILEANQANPALYTVQIRTFLLYVTHYLTSAFKIE